MKKRCLAALLCVLLTATLCVPAFAEDMDSELTRVTLAVKKTLSIGDTYSDFDGEVSDLGALRYWNLRWSDDAGGSLSVMADAQGKIYTYSVDSQAVPVNTTGGYAPTLSKVTEAQALKSAENFLSAVLTTGETASLEAAGGYYALSGFSDYNFSGTLRLNGVPGPDTVQVEVNRQTGKVLSYSRGDGYKAYVNALPSAQPAVSAEKASASFVGAAKLELQYVASDDGTSAELRYVPVSDGGSWYVDAQTGRLTDMNDAWNKLQRASGSTAESTAAADDGTQNKLSDAEQAAVEKLKGVQSKDALDAAVRKVTALGLGRYTLSSAYYQADEEDVSCTLYYTRTLSAGELNTASGVKAADAVQTRIITVDARTAALQSGWTYRPWYAKDLTADRGTLRSGADAFLKSVYPAYAGQTALTDGEDSTFQYDRQVNGYFYHGDYVSIDMDPSDGSVAGFSSSWSDAMTFGSAEGVISADKAKAAYCAAFQTQLCYLGEPVSVDVSIPVWKTYSDCCGSVAYRYVLGYTWEQTGDAVLGVDAKTGKLVRMSAETASAGYTDLSGSFAKKQIEALAAAGVRFGASESFRPKAQLTEQDMLVLLLNSCGYSFDADQLDDASLDNLYQAAWSQGFLTKGSRHPQQAVTRLELVKAIIGASPYGPAAQLKGIFVTSFRDEKSISAADLGYVAVAEGLGMVRGDSAHRFNPDRVVSRQAAAAILYAYMDR